LQNDRNDCGGCGVQCGPGTACVGGACKRSLDGGADAHALGATLD